MNQSERKAAAIGNGAAVIYECSNSPEFKIPRLTIMLPWVQGAEGQKDDPPQSICLGADETNELYRLLRDYYGAN